MMINFFDEYFVKWEERIVIVVKLLENLYFFFNLF